MQADISHEASARSSCVSQHTKATTAEVKGKKRERGGGGSTKWNQGMDTDFKSRSELVASITDEDGGLLDSSCVERFLVLLRQGCNETQDGLEILRRRCSLVVIITETEKEDVRKHFVKCGGLCILGEWLQERHKGKTGNGGGAGSKEAEKILEELVLLILQAFDKLPIDLEALKSSTIGKTVNQLRSHRNTEIQKRARKLVDLWKKRVDLEIKLRGEASQFSDLSHSNESSKGEMTDGNTDADVITRRTSDSVGEVKNDDNLSMPPEKEHEKCRVNPTAVEKELADSSVITEQADKERNSFKMSTPEAINNSVTKPEVDLLVESSSISANKAEMQGGETESKLCEAEKSVLNRENRPDKESDISSHQIEVDHNTSDNCVKLGNTKENSENSGTATSAEACDVNMVSIPHQVVDHEQSKQNIDSSTTTTVLGFIHQPAPTDVNSCPINDHPLPVKLGNGDSNEKSNECGQSTLESGSIHFGISSTLDCLEAGKSDGNKIGACEESLEAKTHQQSCMQMDPAIIRQPCSEVNGVKQEMDKQEKPRCLSSLVVVENPNNTDSEVGSKSDLQEAMNDEKRVGISRTMKEEEEDYGEPSSNIEERETTTSSPATWASQSPSDPSECIQDNKPTRQQLHAFDLNLGPTTEDMIQDGVSVSSANSAIVVPLSTSTPPSLSAPIASKGIFIPLSPSPYSGSSNKNEYGWKGSAATSAFRPAEPRRVLSAHSDPDGSYSTIHTTGKQIKNRPDFDLNVLDEGFPEEGVSCQSILSDNNKVGENSAHQETSARKSLQLDLNCIDESENTCEVVEGLEGSTKLSSGKVVLDFDLNSGPSEETLPVEHLSNKKNEASSSSSWQAPMNMGTTTTTTTTTVLPQSILGSSSQTYIPIGSSSSVIYPSNPTFLTYPAIPFPTNISVNSLSFDPPPSSSYTVSPLRDTGSRISFPAARQQFVTNSTELQGAGSSGFYGWVRPAFDLNALSGPNAARNSSSKEAFSHNGMPALSYEEQIRVRQRATASVTPSKRKETDYQPPPRTEYRPSSWH